MLFEWPFNGFWRLTWPEKPLKRVSGAGDWSLFSGLEGLGGVLGPLGAQELILIDVWLIFDGFGLIFDGFLEDFSIFFHRFLMSPSDVQHVSENAEIH